MKILSRAGRIITVAILLAALLLPLASCSGGTPAESAESTKPAVPGPALVADGKIVYELIRSSNASNTLVQSATALNKLIGTLTGLKTKYTEDFITRETADNDKTEILIGATNRPASSEILATLKTMDWFIGKRGNKILIIGGSDDATVKAIDAFSDMLKQAFDGAADPAAVTMDFLNEEYLTKGEYAGKVIKIAGTPITDYSVCYLSTTSSGAPAAKDKLLSAFSASLGTLPEAHNSNKKAEAGAKEIIIGDCVSRDVTAGLTDRLSGRIPYGITCKNGQLILSGKDSWGMNSAIAKLMEFVAEGKDIEEGYSEFGDASGTVIFDLSEGADIRIMSNNVWKCDTNQDAWKAMGENCSAEVRGKGFAAVYIAFKPDIINLQEMSVTMLTVIMNEMKKAGLNYKRLTTAPTTPDDTPILYNADTLKMLENGHHNYAYGNNGNSKGYHWAYFEHLATGTKFIDLSTHLWWKSEEAQPGSDKWRNDQCVEIVNLSNKLIGQYNCPMFIQGDLNMNISAAAYSVLTKGDFKDCYNLAAVKDNTHGHHECGPSGYSTELYSGGYEKAIDHSLVKNAGDWKIICFRQPVANFFWNLSDHIPIYVDVKFQ